MTAILEATQTPKDIAIGIFSKSVISKKLAKYKSIFAILERQKIYITKEWNLMLYKSNKINQKTNKYGPKIYVMMFSLYKDYHAFKTTKKIFNFNSNITLKLQIAQLW